MATTTMLTKFFVGPSSEPLKGAPEDYFRVAFEKFPKLREWTLQRPEGSTQPVVGDLLQLRRGNLRVATVEVIEPKEEDIARFGERAVRVRQTCVPDSPPRATARTAEDRPAVRDAPSPRP